MLLRIEEAEEKDLFFDVISELGNPQDVAKEFMENLDIPVKYPVIIGFSYSLSSYEYMSKKHFFGIPLVHINIGGRYRTKVAKGIIAIGDISFGIISIGGISVGLLSLGGLSLGLLALGGIAIGFLAIGGIAIGGAAIGGIAIGINKALGALLKVIK